MLASFNFPQKQPAMGGACCTKPMMKFTDPPVLPLHQCCLSAICFNRNSEK